MRIITFITFVVLMGMAFFVFTSFSNDLNTNYPDNQINNSLWAGRYDNSSEINASVAPLVERFSEIQDEDRGFFSKIGSGIVAIPYAIILFPSLALDSLGVVSGALIDIAQNFGIPTEILFMGILLLTIYIVGRLLSFFQRSEP